MKETNEIYEASEGSLTLQYRRKRISMAPGEEGAKPPFSITRKPKYTPKVGKIVKKDK